MALGLAAASPVLGEGLLQVRPEKVGLSGLLLGRIAAILRADIDRGVIPGAVVLVARRGKVAYFESFGRLNRGGAPMRRDAIFRIYSMTKPIVSVAALILYEEGRLTLTEAVSKYIPEFANPSVAVERRDKSTGESFYDLVPAAREMTIRDLLRHTSGLTYETFGESYVKILYRQAGIGSRDQTLEEMVAKMAQQPLASQPGSRWEYSRSLDIMGRLIEIISGRRLDDFIRDRILRPLGMADTGGWVPEEKHRRLAQGAPDQDTGKIPKLIDVTAPPKLLSGSGGMVSTASDYAKFCQALLGKGRLGGARLLSRKVVEYMTSDHLGDLAGSGPDYMPGAGYGFGLGVAVRLQPGVPSWMGTVGDYFWGGWGGSYFWVDPREELVVVFLMQDPEDRLHYRALMRGTVYQAIID